MYIYLCNLSINLREQKFTFFRSLIFTQIAGACILSIELLKNNFLRRKKLFFMAVPVGKLQNNKFNLLFNETHFQYRENRSIDCSKYGTHGSKETLTMARLSQKRRNAT